LLPFPYPSRHAGTIKAEGRSSSPGASQSYERAPNVSGTSRYEGFEVTLIRRTFIGICLWAVGACLWTAAFMAVAASAPRLPTEFTGCYDEVGDGTTCRQPTKEEKKDYFCPGGGLLVNSRQWTTFEDWTCSFNHISERNAGFLQIKPVAAKGYANGSESFGSFAQWLVWSC
jgi:hypothetical protein